MERTHDSDEVIEFLKLVEQARAEGEEAPTPELPDAHLKDLPRPKKYKFGKKKSTKPRDPIEVIIREAQQAQISPVISAAAILVALFVAYTAAVSMGL